MSPKIWLFNTTLLWTVAILVANDRIYSGERVAVRADNSAKLWQRFINATLVWSEKFAENFESKFVSLAERANVSKACLTSGVKTFEAVKRLDDWAYMLINSWGSFPPAGLLAGTISDFGSYDQCLSIEPNAAIGEPQYCMVDLAPPLPRPMPKHHNLYHSVDVLPDSLAADNAFSRLASEGSSFYWIAIRTGICVPSLCTPADVESMAKIAGVELGLESRTVQCQTKQATRLTGVQIVAVLFVAVFLLSGLVATLAERVLSPKKKSLFIEAFSVRLNINRLLSRQTGESLACIHGIRVLTIFWVILGHTVVWAHFQIFTRSFTVKEVLTSGVNQILLNVEYGVDTIFFISGLLTTYISLGYANEKLANFTIAGFLVSRFARLTPQLAIFLLLNFLMPLTGSGPLWSELMTKLETRCYSNWWLNLIYAQNFIRVDSMCAHHTWYTAADMQFHFMSLFVVLAFLYSARLGLAVNALAIAVFTVCNGVMVYVYDLPPAVINTGRDEHFEEYYVNLFYYKPWPHAIVFFTGLAFGYLIYRKAFVKLNTFNFYLIWSAILVGLCVPMMDDQLWNYGQPYSRLVSAFFHPLCRLVWSLAIASLVWCCVSSNGGLVNRLLSCRAFVPLARLTYSVYLTHAWVVWTYYGSRRERIDMSSYSFVLIFSHNLVLSYIVGALFAVLFESPTMVLVKRVFVYFKLVAPAQRINGRPLLTAGENNNRTNKCSTVLAANNEEMSAL